MSNSLRVALIAFLFLTLATSSSFGRYEAIGDFDTLLLGPLVGQDGWFAQSGTIVAIDPVDSGNQVLAVTSPNILARRSMVIPLEETRSMFMRFRVADELNASFGLSYLAQPVEQNDFGPELTLTAAQNELRVENGTANDTVATLDENEWYNLWVEIDNPANTLRVWLNQGSRGANASDQLTNVLGEDVFDFRSNTNQDLLNFYIKNGSGGPGDYGPLYIDDIYLESREERNLANPAASCNEDNQGDFDGNGTVEFADFLLLAANFGTEVPNHTFGDADCNGDVEFVDFLLLSKSFGNDVAQGAVSNVPEPHSLSGVMLCLALSLCRGLGGRKRSIE